HDSDRIALPARDPRCAARQEPERRQLRGGERIGFRGARARSAAGIRPGARARRARSGAVRRRISGVTTTVAVRRLAVTTIALWASVTALTHAAPDVDTLLGRIGDRIAEYYKRAQNVICVEKSTVQPI